MQSVKEGERYNTQRGTASLNGPSNEMEDDEELGNDNSDRDSMTEEASLVERIRSGDEEAAGELDKRYRRGMLLALRKKIGDAALAEDLWQDAVMSVLRAIQQGRLKDADKLSSFIWGVGHNLAKNHFKKTKGIREESINDDLSADEQDSPFHVLRRKENNETIRKAFKKLKPDRYRLLLYRYHFAEESKEEICREMGLSKGQFAVTLFRARKKLHKILTKELGRHTKDNPDGNKS